MIPQGNRVTVGNRKNRPSTAKASASPFSLNQISAQPNRLTDGDITKHLLQIKDSDLELAKARFDFQINLEKQRSYDYQNMLKENYEGAAKMFQKINNEQLELIKKENENVIQKLLKRHNDEILSLTTKNEQELRAMTEEKRKMSEVYEDRMKTMKKEFTEVLEKNRYIHEQQKESLREELKDKYEKKLEVSKNKMKAKMDAIKEKNDKKVDEKLDNMFEKMNGEFEKRQNELYNSIVEKDEIIKSLEKKLAMYQLEINKWKDLHYASQTNQTLINAESINQKKEDIIRTVGNLDFKERKIEQTEEIAPSLESSRSRSKDIQNFSPERQLVSRIEKISKYESPKAEEDRLESSVLDVLENEKKQKIENEELNFENKLKLSNESEKAEKNDQQKEQAAKSLSEQVKALVKVCNAETMTENYWEGKQSVEQNAESDAELACFIAKAEEKAHGIVERDLEVIRFYQNSLVKCLGKIKEYQLLIQKFNEGA